MNRAEYRAMLVDLGPVGAEYLFWNDAYRLPYAMLDALYCYLTGKD